jgi:hypothetical protein
MHRTASLSLSLSLCTPRVMKPVAFLPLDVLKASYTSSLRRHTLAAEGTEGRIRLLLGEVTGMRSVAALYQLALLRARQRKTPPHTPAKIQNIYLE